MNHKLFFTLFLFCYFTSAAQFKNDNVLYKTVDPADLCAILEKNKGYILLDVRSTGEHHDTSHSLKYNLGHLKGARNIDVGELGNRLPEIEDHKDQPVFVYCSHSQRSRRASKMLADSGFTKIFNINGGMTAIYYSDAKKKDCLTSLVETNNPYEIISATELSNRINKKIVNDVFVLDVRSDSAFRHISKEAKENAYGHIAGAVNIPLADLPQKLSSIAKQGKQIVVTDMYGDDASSAAVLLKKNGFDRVSVLIEGIDRLLYTDGKDFPGKKNLYKSPSSYELITTSEFGRYASTHSNFTLLDIRTTEEAENKHKDYWRNIGHLKNSINIPATVLEKNIDGLGNDKGKEIIIYGFGNGPEMYAVADGLQKEGFTKIKVIVGGIFNMRWAAGNVKGQSYLKDWVIDVPEINQ